METAMKHFAIGAIAATAAVTCLSLVASTPADATRYYHRMRDSTVISVPDKVSKPPKGYQTKERWEKTKEGPKESKG
jgi:hypothetical protein